MEIKEQKFFPLLEEYRKHFKVTNETIFAYCDTIYVNGELPADLLIHEQTHLDRQNKLGADSWVKLYLTDKSFRRNEELLAYRAQLKSIKNKELKNKIRIESARNLSSPLYKLDLTYDEAWKLLKV